MTKLPQIRPKQVIKKLEKLDMKVERVAGSHYILRSLNGDRYATVPYHNKPLKKGTLRNIIRGAKLTVEEFIKL